MNKGDKRADLKREGALKSSRELIFSGESVPYALAQKGIVGRCLKIVNSRDRKSILNTAFVRAGFTARSDNSLKLSTRSPDINDGGGGRYAHRTNELQVPVRQEKKLDPQAEIALS